MEFKHNNSDPQEIGEYVSALANGAALHRQPQAFLLWGIEDYSHNLVGTTFKPRQARKGNEELENWLHRLLSPHIDFSFQEGQVGGRDVVLIVIQPASHQPVSGIKKVIAAVEQYQLPAPDFRATPQHAIAVLDAPRSFADMDRQERIRACYQHACLWRVLSADLKNPKARAVTWWPRRRSRGLADARWLAGGDV